MQNTNVPIGWSFKRVQDMGRVITGSTPPMSDKDNYGNEFCWATAQDFKSKYIDDTVVKLSNKGKTLSRVLPAGSVLVTCIASIGLNAIAKTEMATNQQINAIIPNDDFCSDFLYYLFCYNTDKLKQYAGGGGILILSKGEFEKIRFMLPPIKEQEKIAEVLGTWDRAIEELSDLITEKKELKRGLMQRLLTGTQRLPGFTKTWKNTKLGDIGVITSAGVDKKSIEGEKTVKLLNYMDVYKKDFLFASDVNMDVTASDRQIVNCNLKKGDVFFTPSSETRDDIAHSAVVMEDVVDGVYSYHIIRLRPTTEIDIKYTAYVFKTGMFYKQAYALCEGSGQRYVLSQNYFRNMKIYIPSDPAEQKAIADVLFKSDAEIDLLNQQLDVLKEQKRGLMQKLLTGEIRVKADTETC